jgi:hypothetical protein
MVHGVAIRQAQGDAISTTGDDSGVSLSLSKAAKR